MAWVGTDTWTGTQAWGEHGGSAQTVSPTGIASAESVGSPTVVLTTRLYWGAAVPVPGPASRDAGWNSSNATFNYYSIRPNKVDLASLTLVGDAESSAGVVNHAIAGFVSPPL